MAKFYCQSGQFKEILTANDIEDVILKAVKKIVKNNIPYNFVMSISETGFSLSGSLLVSIVPILRDMNIELPSDDVIIMQTCITLNFNPETLTKQGRDWILNGGDLE